VLFLTSIHFRFDVPPGVQVPLDATQKQKRVDDCQKAAE
jgi:hypothetical protein